MKILSIDTASNLCTVAVLEDTTCIKELIVNDARNHSEKIMPVIEQVLNDTNLHIKDIDLIVCDKGPGSFTGIRIGVGTVLGFRDVLNVNCVGISSLESLAYNVKLSNHAENNLICSLIDAKNDNVYYGLFENSNNKISQIGDLDFKKINDIIPLLKDYQSPIIFVGDGATFYSDFIKNSFDNCLFSKNNDLSSISLGIAGYNAFLDNRKTSIMPLYLRKSQAERALEDKK